jgi:putative transposase
MILELIDKAMSGGARLQKAAAIAGLSARSVIRWRQTGVVDDRRIGPKVAPANKLSENERAKIVNVANSASFRDMSPKQIVPNLADQGIYIGSESSFYRVLKEQKMINHRQQSKPATHHRPNAHVATGPCQVWSWDITYLRSPVRGMFFYLYMIVDVWSRKVVAASVFEEESMDLSARLFTRACFTHQVAPEGLVLHSDNGGPMKGSVCGESFRDAGRCSLTSRRLLGFKTACLNKAAKELFK